jgi:hypothetical protein
MRFHRLLAAAFALPVVIGCSLFMPPKPPAPPHTGTISKVSADQLVGYLNAQSGRLQTISYGEASVTAKQGDDFKDRLKSMTFPVLRGSVAASQPRNFRMVVGGGAISTTVDMGSNSEVFWMSARIPTQEPMFVFASHNDFETGKAKLPPGVTFEPDWVMQAMGMTTFAPNAEYTVRTDEKDRSYVLSWPAKTPSGMQIRKEVVFAVDDADASRNEPQVRKHLIRDAKGKVLCSAEIRAAKTVEAGGTDPTSKRHYVLQYPTHIVLRWEEPQKFEMTLKLEKATVNQPMQPEDARRLFTLPTNQGVSPLNLAEARFTP